MNIYAGRRFAWGWQDHLDHGFLGGDDMVTTVGEIIKAPVAGKVTRTLHTVMITEPDGWRTQALELGSTVSQSSVHVGNAIGVASLKYVHWHSFNPQGIRVEARFLQPELSTAGMTPAETETTMASLVQNTAGNPATVVCIRDGYPIRTVAGNEYTAFLAAYGPLRTTASVDEFNFIILEANQARTAFLAQFTRGDSGYNLADADVVDETELATAADRIIEALASGNKDLLAAIASVDESTLASFGLKRA